jgi:HPt (histidine-containing phosphotransfer) domain-containing protein
MTDQTKLRSVPKQSAFCESFKKPARKTVCGYNEALESFTECFDKTVARNLLNEFVEAVESVLNELHEKAPSRNLKMVKPLTHRLIGLCPIYKANRLSELSQAMEKEMALERWEQIEAHVIECRDAFAQYMGAERASKKASTAAPNARSAQKARLKIVK